MCLRMLAVTACALLAGSATLFVTPGRARADESAIA
ncbi:MAG: hypothetical protein QOI41_1636, partial [Myxococcales bacterium]|nr:hypothetical protein [Myxococcales bacterium]